MASEYDVMVMGPHPDDVEFQMAGTVIKFVKAGYKVMHVALTNSSMSTHGDIVTRKGEFEAAAKLMGCDCRMLDFMDTGVVNDRESQVKIARLFRELRPKIVFAPFHTNPLGEPRGLAHVDHYTSGQLIRDAVKFSRLQRIIPDMPAHTVRKLYFYMIPRDVWANLVVDITDVAQETKKAIEAYKSQVTPVVDGGNLVDNLMRHRSANGLAIGVPYAESFVCDTPTKMTPEDFLRF